MRHLRVLLIATVIGVPALAAYGQQTGEVTGTVTDATGALVAGATVTATNTATQQVRSVISNDTGTYTIPYLQPAVLRPAHRKGGFQDHRPPERPGTSRRSGAHRFQNGGGHGFAERSGEYRRTAPYHRIGLPGDGRRVAADHRLASQWARLPGSCVTHSQCCFRGSGHG